MHLTLQVRIICFELIPIVTRSTPGRILFVHSHRHSIIDLQTIKVIPSDLDFAQGDENIFGIQVKTYIMSYS